MIINLHGFGGNGKNTKYYWLQANYPNEEIYSPTIDYTKINATEICAMLKEKVQNTHESIFAIGSSWGGFFAYCLNAAYKHLPAVLLNPVLHPQILTSVELQSGLELIPSYLDEYHKHIFKHNSECCSAVIGTQDEVIQHDAVTIPVFHYDLHKNIYKFPFGHAFDIESETGVQDVIRKTLAMQSRF